MQPAPALSRRLLADALRRYRTRARLTVTQAAGELGFSVSKLSRLETGSRLVGLTDLESLSRLYELSADERAELTSLIESSRQRSIWRELGELDPGTAEFAELEYAATTIHDYKTSVITALLQTADYTRALIRAFEPDLPEYAVQTTAEARSLRQRAVLGRSDHPNFVFIFDEAAARRQVGGTDVMREQLQHLGELSHHPLVSIHVIPFAAGAHVGMDSLFTILSFREAVRDIVYIDGLDGQVMHSGVDDVRRYRGSFSQLQRLALDVSASREFLARIAEEIL